MTKKLKNIFSIRADGEKPVERMGESRGKRELFSIPADEISEANDQAKRDRKTAQEARIRERENRKREIREQEELKRKRLYEARERRKEIRTKRIENLVSSIFPFLFSNKRGVSGKAKFSGNNTNASQVHIPGSFGR